MMIEHSGIKDIFTQGFMFHYVIFPHNRNTVRLVTTSDNKLINLLSFLTSFD